MIVNSASSKQVSDINQQANPPSSFDNAGADYRAALENMEKTLDKVKILTASLDHLKLKNEQLSLLLKLSENKRERAVSAALYFHNLHEYLLTNDDMYEIAAAPQNKEPFDTLVTELQEERRMANPSQSPTNTERKDHED